MARRSFTGAAASTTLASGMTAGATTFLVASAVGYPVSVNPFVVVVGRGTATEEKILVQSITGTTFAVALSGRGYDSTAAQSHTGSETVEHCLDSLTIDEANAHVADTTLDNHTQYLNAVRHDVTARHAFGAALPTPAAPASVGTTAAAGVAAGPARADHVHILGTGAVSAAAMLAAGVVTTSAIAANAVTAAQIASATITATQLAAGSVTAFAIATDAVNADELANNAVDTAAIVDNAVTTAKIAALAVTVAELAVGSVTAIALGAGAVSQTALYADAKLKRALAERIPVGTASHATTTYIPYPNDAGGTPLTLAFTKQHGTSVTALAVRVYATGFMVNQLDHSAILGIKSGASTDHGTIALRYFNAINQHQTLAGELVASGLAAGSHTLTLQCKVSVGGGVTAFNADANDRFLMVVEEVWI